MIDIIKVADSIAETMTKTGEPLTENQRTCLAGALGIWLLDAYKAGQDFTLEEVKKAILES